MQRKISFWSLLGLKGLSKAKLMIQKIFSFHYLIIREKVEKKRHCNSNTSKLVIFNVDISKQFSSFLAKVRYGCV